MIKINEFNQINIKNALDPKLVQEADNLSKETRIDFRDCLLVCIRASALSEQRGHEEVKGSLSLRSNTCPEKTQLLKYR